MRALVRPLLLIALTMIWVMPAAAVVHPGIYSSTAELDWMENRVEASAQPWLGEFNALPAHSGYNPQTTRPTHTLEGHPAEPGVTALRNDCRTAYGAALKWYAQETTTARDKAIEILNWLTGITTFRGETGTSALLRVSELIPDCIAAAEIMRYHGGGAWSAGNITTFENWLKNTALDYVRRASLSGTPANRSNHATLAAKARMAIGVFTNDQALYEDGLNDARLLIDFYIGNRFGSVNVSGSVPTGFTFETCRQGSTPTGGLAGGDLNHTQFGLQGLLEAAEIARHQGDDLYGRLHTTTTFVSPSDNAGLQTALLYHDQWIGRNEGRSGSSSSGWPCAVALTNVGTGQFNRVWALAAERYGDASFISLRDWAVGRSNDIFFLTHQDLPTGPSPDTTDPTVPGSPAAAAISDTAITVSWTASTDPGTPASGVTTYRIDQCSTAGCAPSTQLTTVPATQLSFTHTNLGPVTLHRYRVRAIDAAGNDSAQTATVEATTNAAPSPPPTTGPSIYVSWNNGNDTTGTGAIGAPYKTLDKACSVVDPGETIVLRGQGTIVSNGTGCGNGTSWNAPVTIRNFPGETATLTRDPVERGFFSAGTISQPKYWIIQGEDDPSRPLPNTFPQRYGKRLIFDFFGIGKASGGAPGDFVRIEDVEFRNCACTSAIEMGNNWEFRRNYVHHNGDAGLSHGIYAHPSRSIIEDNVFEYNSGWGLHLFNNKANTNSCVQGEPHQLVNGVDNKGCGNVGLIVRNNLLRFSRLGGNLILSSGRDNQVYNNVSLDPGIERTGGPPVAMKINSLGAKIWNNTLYRGQLQVEGKCDNCEFRNNLIWRPGASSNTETVVDPPCTGCPVAIDPTVSGFVSDHNLYSNAAAPTPPIVLNATAGDFRLHQSSPAINAGVNLAGVPRDALGVGRVGDTDIGAFEFGGVVTCPTDDCEPPSTPPAPTLTLQSSPLAVLGDWADSTGTPTGYKVYRCEVPDGETSCAPSVVVISPPVSAFSDTTVTAGRSYSYAVSSIDAALNESPQSAVVSIFAGTPVSDVVAPSVPTGLSCSGVSHTQGNCNWTASTDNEGGTGVAGYRIRRLTGACGTPATQVDTTANTSYAHTGLSASATYCVAVAAFDAASPPNVSAYTSPVSFTTTAPPTAPKICLNLDNNLQDSCGTNHATGATVTFTTTAAQLDTGSTHAAVIDAEADVISIPLTGFTSPNHVTIALSFYATAAFSGPRYLLSGTTTPAFANRWRIRMEGNKLQYGLGGSGTVNSDVLGSPLSINVRYRTWLKINLDGTYDGWLARAGQGFIKQVSGTYSGLTALPTVLGAGNQVELVDVDRWQGSIDTIVIENRGWSQAEVTTDCANLGFGCTPPSPPTFDPFDMDSGIQGDGASADNNTSIIVTMTGNPDPAACADLSQFFVAYGQVREPVVGCTITGSRMDLTVAAPPPSTMTPLALTYLPTAQQITLTNSTVPDPAAGTGLEQLSWWCRPDRLADTTPWEGLPNNPCLVPSPGVTNLRVDLLNSDAAASPPQDYSLWCDDDPAGEAEDPVDATPPVRVSEDASAPLGMSLHVSTLGVVDGTPRTPVLPNPEGVTAVTAGTFRRRDVSSIAPILQPNTRTEYEFSLRVASGLTRGTQFYCELRPTASGAPLAAVNKAVLRIDRARFFSQ